MRAGGTLPIDSSPERSDGVRLSRRRPGHFVPGWFVAALKARISGYWAPAFTTNLKFISGFGFIDFGGFWGPGVWGAVARMGSR